MILSSSINLSKIIPYKEKTYMEFTYINYSKQCDIKQYFSCERSQLAANGISCNRKFPMI